MVSISPLEIDLFQWIYGIYSYSNGFIHIPMEMGMGQNPGTFFSPQNSW